MWPDGPDGISRRGRDLPGSSISVPTGSARATLSLIRFSMHKGGPREYKNGLGVCRAPPQELRLGARGGPCGDGNRATDRQRRPSTISRGSRRTSSGAAAERPSRSCAPRSGRRYTRVQVPLGLGRRRHRRFASRDSGRSLAAGRRCTSACARRCRRDVFASLTPARVKQMAKLDENEFAWCGDLGGAGLPVLRIPETLDAGRATGRDCTGGRERSGPLHGWLVKRQTTRCRSRRRISAAV